ncbi:MAG: hypothetical protein GY868_07450, partial [Deltaproteobacteria bacterium]|nr:hypothetical protein [Deltaproteobacteria bacterium]
CENLQVSLDENIVMAGSFNLEVPQTAPSRFNINIATDPINISALHKYRDVLLPRAQGLFRTIESGTLQIEDFRYQCRLGDAEESSGPAVSGRLSLRNITAVPGCALPGIHLKDGVLTLDGDTLKGSLAGTWLEADSHAASISVQSLYDNPLYSLKLESALPAAPLNTVLQQVSVTTAAADVLRMLDGTVKITTRITNTPGGRIVSDFDLTDASYGVLNSVVKPVGMINRLQLNSEFDAAAPIKFNFLIQDSLKFAGRVDKQQFSRVSGSYSLKDVVLDDFTFPELPPPLCVTGRLNGKGTFEAAANSSNASLAGNLRLDGFSIREEERPEPYVAVSCAADLQDNSTLIESGSARVGATRFSFAGTLETLVP